MQGYKVLENLECDILLKYQLKNSKMHQHWILGNNRYTPRDRAPEIRNEMRQKEAKRPQH